MSFVGTLRDHKVTLFTHTSTTTAMVLAGLLLWSAPLALYITAWRTVSASDSVNTLWSVNVGVHCGVGALVVVEALVTVGRFWPLQTAIIGGATYVTFSVAGLLGYHASTDDGVAIVASDLACACVANAVLVSILFELFHRGLVVPAARVSLQTTILPVGGVLSARRSSSV